VDAVPVVWVASVDAVAERSPQADRAMEEWGRAHGILLVAPGVVPPRDLPVDSAVSDAVEAEIEHARDATSAQDGDASDRALARAETLLHDHPELPQGAWLMAEVQRGWATRWARVPPRDPERAAAAWRRARGLDGGREAGVGEEAVSAVDPDVGFALTLDGYGDARLDGAPVAAGAHQVTVTRSGRLVWAGWVAVTEGATARVALPEIPRCSLEDFARVRLRDRAVLAAGVGCARWVAASPAPDPGSVFVSLCAMDRCGALVEWRVGAGVPPIADRAEHPSRWPAWATWTLVGAGAVVVAGAAVGIDAAAHSGGASVPPFVSGGLKTTSGR